MQQTAPAVIEPPKRLRVSYEDENAKKAQEKQHGEAVTKVSTSRIQRLSETFRNLADISNVNFLSGSNRPRGSDWSRGSSIQPSHIWSLQALPLNSTDSLPKQFPRNVTTLMNEDQLWGCFYIFPELYNDIYSPIIKIRTTDELGVESIKDGILNRDLIATCLSYLARSPISGDYVYIKLDLSSQQLQDVSALKGYRFLQYLDLSKNLLTDLQVLSHLPYLQYLAVSFNRLSEVLDYKCPQWFLSEVHYRYNYIKKIRDLTSFWSITVLDFSHNNIKVISGLSNLRFLRKLDLSFNHIQRLENLSNMRLTWLDLSYNNITSFDSGPNQGLKTLHHLDFLDMNENKLTSFKIFSGCSSLRELHIRNNRLSNLLELALYMRNLRSLSILDLRENPIHTDNKYRTVVLSTLPSLLQLDDGRIDPMEQVRVKMQMVPDVINHATRRLLRLLYIEQLSQAGGVTTQVPAADTTEVPLVVLVGPEASGKGALCRRLAAECSDHVRHALLHTTDAHHEPMHYKLIDSDKMDDMLVTGQLLTYSEKYGESYGLSRAEAFVSDGLVTVTAMEQLPALMLRLRHRRPYLILASCEDQHVLSKRQAIRRRARHESAMEPRKASTLQVLISGRIEVTGILQEIIMTLPDERQASSFALASDCSLEQKTLSDLLDPAEPEEVNAVEPMPDPRDLHYSHEIGKETIERPPNTHNVPSLFSLYKSQGTADYSAEVHWQPSSVEFSVRGGGAEQSTSKDEQQTQRPSYERTNVRASASVERTRRVSSEISRPKSVADTSRYTTSTWKAGADSTKSVTFLSRDLDTSLEHLGRLTGLLIEDQGPTDKLEMGHSISRRMPAFPESGRSPTGCSEEDRAAWYSLMQELGLLRPADELHRSDEIMGKDSRASNLKQQFNMLINYCSETPRRQSIIFKETGSSLKDGCESLHRKFPGIFWDTLNMDDTEKSYTKLRRIVKDIVNSQSKLKPMFDIDSKSSHIPIVKSRLEAILEEIAPTRLFY